MAATINVNVNVDDGPFAVFARKFADYQEKLNKTPGAWEKVSRSSEESAVHFDMIAAALAQQADDMTRIADKMSSVRKESGATERSWRNIAHLTSQTAGHVKNATAALVQWSSAIGLVTGAIGLLSGYYAFRGMESMGAGVSANRSAALGAGTSYGGRSAFLTNFARMGDAAGFLGRVSDVSRSADNVPLSALGLTQEQIQGDSADVGANAILKLKELVDSVKDPRFLADTLAARRANELISLQQAQTLRGMSPEEVNALVAAYRRDKGAMSLSTDAQRKWQDFSTQLDRAGREIENTFVKRLAALAPSITGLSSSFVKLTDRLMEKDGPISKWLDALADGIQSFAARIDSPTFSDDINNFVAGVEKIAAMAGKFIDFLISAGQMLGIFPDVAQPNPGAGQIRGGYTPGAPFKPTDNPHFNPVLGGGTGSHENDDTPEAAAERARRRGAAGGAAGGGGFVDSLASIESSNRNIYSRTDPDTAGPNSRSQGYFQIGTPTWEQFAPRAGVDLSKYPNAMSAPREVQAQVAEVIPFGRFGGRTRRLMRQRFGAIDDSETIGGAAARLDSHKREVEEPHRKERAAVGGGGEWSPEFRTPAERRAAGPNSPPANSRTIVTITRPAGADPNIAAAAAAAP